MGTISIRHLPDGKTIATSIDDAMTWQGILPMTGDYIIEIDAVKPQYRVNVDVK